MDTVYYTQCWMPHRKKPKVCDRNYTFGFWNWLWRLLQAGCIFCP